MRTLAWLLAVLAAAVALALYARADAGYLILVYPPYRIEMSLVLAGFALAAGFAVLYALLRLLGRTLALPAQVRAYRERRRRDHAAGALAAALQAYYEGRYARAEKEAAVAQQAGFSPGVAALLAARASHELRDVERRDRWLERAAKAGEGAQAARLVTHAELALEERDFVRARDALKSLHGGGPRHIATQRMLLRAELGAGNWEEVLRLATQLAKRDAIAPALAEEYRVQAYLELLKRASGSRPELEARWRSIPSREQVRPRIAAAAARDAAALGAGALAREILEQALAEEWSPPLVALYGDLPASLDATARASEARARIERAERWLGIRPQDPQLLSALGRLCAQAELWGKARSLLEASVGVEETSAAHLELARLAERLGQKGEAERHYRRAAELEAA